MPINFFSIRSKIRNKIYKEALMLSELIIFVATPYRIFQGLALPRNSRVCKPLRLCPEILLANKRVHREASLLVLYLIFLFILTV
jgi:predicted nucleic acid-binding Zn ribbon protein